MATIRSDEAVHGSAKSRPYSKPPEDLKLGKARILRFIHDTAWPISPTLVGMDFSQSNLSSPRDYSKIFSPVDNLFDGPPRPGFGDQAKESRARPQISIARIDIAKDVKFVGTSFDEPLSALTATELHLDRGDGDEKRQNEAAKKPIQAYGQR
ncbi:hypothetical protein F5Y13DRAFT_189281 [Hypoxylon sp. FL1857]|nr:hypothetical protein F5Y13DRAFT_189281 [Hypoxylon sp. FL1857]